MSYSQFTIEERDMLQVLQSMEVPRWAIARFIGKNISSIYRELSRNSTSGLYLSHRAQKATEKRRRISRPKPKFGNTQLMTEVIRRIKKDHSPEQIAGRLKLENPEDPNWQVSHETIYQYVYAQVHQEPELRIHLRQGQKKRRKRLSGKDKRGVIPNRTFIDERPAIVEEKSRIGDWEGDTVEGGNKKGYIATFVERKSKFLVGYTLDHKTSHGLVKKARRAFAKLPEGYLETLTVDNGKEFANHEGLAKATKTTVYFAHPYHSWERGLNEHTNGLLRQYFPKGMQLDNLSPQELAKVIRKINNRPRKSLGYRTPWEVFHAG
jgi:IS30 family transposase